MTKEDFKKIALAIKTTFPSSPILQTQEAMDMWYMFLQDLDYKVCQNAVLEIISTSKFPPTIAEIREKCSHLISLPVKDYGEAWESVLKAIRKFGYPRELEALESLDEVTRSCVKSLGYVNICMSENIVADRANFRDIYESRAQRKKTDNQLPLSLRTEKQKMIDSLIQDTVKQIGG
jgi:hypothetical protein